jgi:hypothetical protein
MGVRQTTGALTPDIAGQRLRMDEIVYPTDYRDPLSREARPLPGERRQYPVQR